MVKYFVTFVGKMCISILMMLCTRIMPFNLPILGYLLILLLNFI